ncbi:hypothetical protein SAMN04490244_10356 [Tranquillimonas rosea]|uniref:Uncharacterized protein n=1 Tax=Tranquillimonas rosea TaxID=641238 RepID=A0A1H9S759_9RHOB|nr:hypothetical protein [Tranquillimonas rosea]SER80781.1 hypothetical protein SAMN04490244_10356 [Tranquillimonas rosea]
MRAVAAGLAMTLVLAGCDMGGRTGVFGPVGTGGDVTAADVPADADLPFGQVARACGVRGRNLGTEVSRAPEDGRAQYRLYDTAPGQTGPRTQYITGFDDNCPRRITAALVTFGSADVHETTRYETANTSPYSPTDDAYEDIKARVCGVRAGAACPADRSDRIAREAVFVSAYPRFGASNRRLELLLHGGDLVAEAASPR